MGNPFGKKATTVTTQPPQPPSGNPFKTLTAAPPPPATGVATPPIPQAVVAPPPSNLSVAPPVIQTTTAPTPQPVVQQATPAEEEAYQQYEAGNQLPVKIYTEDDLGKYRNQLRIALTNKINNTDTSQIYILNDKIKLAELDFYACQRVLNHKHDAIMLVAYDQIAISINAFVEKLQR